MPVNERRKCLAQSRLRPSALLSERPASLTAINDKLVTRGKPRHPTHPAEMAMLKEVMVQLDGSPADEVRPAAGADISENFSINVTGLFLNTLPLLTPSEWDGIGPRQTMQILEEVRANSERVVTNV